MVPEHLPSAVGHLAPYTPGCMDGGCVIPAPRLSGSRPRSVFRFNADAAAIPDLEARARSVVADAGSQSVGIGSADACKRRIGHNYCRDYGREPSDGVSGAR